MDEVERMMRHLVNIRQDYGTIPALIAFAIWLQIVDERVFELARVYVDRLKAPAYAPDWVRILANASDENAIDIAHDDLRISLEENT